MLYYVAQGIVPLQPSCAPQQMTRVCNSFFRFVLQVSQNKLYQSQTQGARNMYSTDFAADDSVRKWLTNYAESHLHDPSKGHTIILSVPSRKMGE